MAQMRSGQGAGQGAASSQDHLPLRAATRTIDSMTHPPTRPPHGPGKTAMNAAILRLPD
jgi:hypothetical protein